MPPEASIKLGELVMDKPAILALLAGIALVALGLAVYLDWRWGR